MSRVMVHGAAGRMGQRLIALASEAGLRVTGAVDAAGSPAIGRDAGELAGCGRLDVPITAEPPQRDQADVLIDFSLPEGFREALAGCVAVKMPLVIGTTGLTASDQARIDDAGRTIPILQASNFSLVVNVLFHLSRQAARLLGDDYDIEILEAHHRYKKDAPSGTALTICQGICEETGRDFQRDVVYARHGDDCTRQANQITMQTLRIGDHPGEHTVYYAAPGERLELRHVSTSRDSYAKGALAAARWLVGKPAGRYSMDDVLFAGQSRG